MVANKNSTVQALHAAIALDLQRLLFASALSLASALVGTQGFAQVASVNTLEEVVVTSRKVAERLQDVPLTVTAFSPEDIQKNKIIKLTDLNNLTPGLNFQEGTGRGGSGRFFVRGLTGGVAGTARASTFLDGVYVANSTSNILFGEMERVEVLLGPQSTQFGRATFGGALNFITKDPKRTWGGNVSLTGGTLGEKDADIFFGGPVVADKILASVFLGYQKFEGPSQWRNPPDVLHPGGVQLGRTEAKEAAVKFVFLPIDELRITARFSINKDHDNQPEVVILGPEYRTAAYSQVRLNCIGTLCTPTAPQPAYYFSGVVHAGAAAKGGFPYAVLNLDQESDPSYRNETKRNTVIADWSLPADNVLKTTISSNYETTEHGNASDSEYTYFPSSRFTPAKASVRDDSVELRLDSSQAQKLRYSVGAYYLDVHTTSDAIGYGDYICNTICTTNNPASIFNTATLTGFTGSISGSLNRTATPSNARNAIRDKSVFAGIFYDFTEQWTASFEGRFQKETVTNLNIANPAAVLGGTVQANRFLPRVNIQYKPTRDLNFYTVLSRGNNPGGVNTAVQIGRPGTGTSESQRPIKEEILDNYELGVKSTWFGNRLRINAAVYHMNWTNLQNSATYFDPASTFFSVTENRGKAKINGIDIEGEWVATKELSFRGTFSANHSYYVQFCSPQLANLLYGPAPASPNALLGADPYCLAQFNVRAVNVAGNELETSPKMTGSLSADYHIGVMNGWTWSTHGTVQYAAGQWESEMNLAKSESAWVYQLTTGVERGPFAFELFCRNCSDETAPTRFTRLTDPRTSTSSVAQGGLAYNQTVSPAIRRPRQWGANLRYKF